MIKVAKRISVVLFFFNLIMRWPASRPWLRHVSLSLIKHFLPYLLRRVILKRTPKNIRPVFGWRGSELKFTTWKFLNATRACEIIFVENSHMAMLINTERKNIGHVTREIECAGNIQVTKNKASASLICTPKVPYLIYFGYFIQHEYSQYQN